MSKKLTLKIVKERLAKINPNIEILSEEYVNSNTYLRCRCLKDGYEWDSKWSNLNQGKKCPKCTNQIKLNIKEIKSKLKEINSNIEIISEEYFNNRAKLECKCLIDEHIWKASWRNLVSGIGCPKCGGSMKLDITTVKNRLKEINPNIKVLSNEYINSKQKLNLECKIDGHRWEAGWATLQIGKGCPKCSPSMKLDIATIKRKLSEINLNIELLSEEWISTKHKIKLKCLKDNYIWETTWNSLRQGNGCPSCSGNARWDIVTIREKIKEINPKIEILSNKYFNNKEKLKCKCLSCEHEWKAVPSSLLGGYGCPECAKLESGWTCSNWIKRSKISRNFDGFKLYKIKCFLIETKETFYKIGITFNKLEMRLRKSKLPYKYEIVEVIESKDGRYIWNLEKELHRQHKEYKYIPQISFGGEGECFSKLIK